MARKVPPRKLKVKPAGAFYSFLHIVICLAAILSPFIYSYFTSSTATQKTPKQQDPSLQRRQATKIQEPTTVIPEPTAATPNVMPLYSCDESTLSQFLHEEAVQGLHVLCLEQPTTAAATTTQDNIRLTLFPNAKHVATTTTTTTATTTTSSPTTQAIVTESFNLNWNELRASLVTTLRLPTTTQQKQPWAIFSPMGERLVAEDDAQQDQQMIIQKLLHMGLVLIYEGGQFVWPGVRIGFQRNIPLHPQHYYHPPPQHLTNASSVILETLSLQPLVFAVKGFLSDDECTHIQHQALPFMQYSEVTLMDQDKGRPSSDFRTSQSTFLSARRDNVLHDIDTRTSQLVRIPLPHQENIQVLRYGKGEKYDAHHDYFDPALYQQDRSTLEHLIQFGKRNRMATVFMYLSDVPVGGETIFPRFNNAPQPRSTRDCRHGLKVQPQRGKVIIFYNLKHNGQMDPLSLHAACPVGTTAQDGQESHIKWAANKWIWNLPIPMGDYR